LTCFFFKCTCFCGEGETTQGSAEDANFITNNHKNINDKVLEKGQRWSWKRAKEGPEKGPLMKKCKNMRMRYLRKSI